MGVYPLPPKSIFRSQLTFLTRFFFLFFFSDKFVVIVLGKKKKSTSITAFWPATNCNRIFLQNNKTNNKIKGRIQYIKNSLHRFAKKIYLDFSLLTGSQSLFNAEILAAHEDLPATEDLLLPTMELEVDKILLFSLSNILLFSRI